MGANSRLGAYSNKYGSSIETNYVIHLIEVSWIALPTFQTTGPRVKRDVVKQSRQGLNTDL